MNEVGFFRLGKTKGGDLFYNVRFGNGGGGCGLLKWLNPWEAIKYRAMATREPEHVAAWEAVISAKENGGDWKLIADDAYRKMIAETL